MDLNSLKRSPSIIAEIRKKKFKMRTIKQKTSFFHLENLLGDQKIIKENSIIIEEKKEIKVTPKKKEFFLTKLQKEIGVSPFLEKEITKIMKKKDHLHKIKITNTNLFKAMRLKNTSTQKRVEKTV